MRWYRKITSTADGDLNALAEALDWFEEQYEEGRKELKVKGRITDVAMRLPGNVEYFYGLSMEAEAIMKWLEVQTAKALQKARKGYYEHYNRELSDRMAEKYAEGDQTVLDYRQLVIHVGLVRAKLHGITKALETLHFQLSNVTKLKAAGVEDATVD